MKKTYYCYNRSNNKLANHTILNPNVKLVRDSFGNAQHDFADDNMRPEFQFTNWVFEAETKEEVEFMDCYVAGKPYKLKNGRMFEPWLAAVYFKAEQIKEDETKQNTVIKNVDRIVIPEESAKLMSLDALRGMFDKMNLTLPDENKTKAELIEILRENKHII